MNNKHPSPKNKICVMKLENIEFKIDGPELERPHVYNASFYYVDKQNKEKEWHFSTILN